MKKAFLVITLAIVVLASVTFAGPPTEVWNKTYESGGNDQAFGVATDAAGNAYVTGFYGDLSTAACRTIKYDPDGNVLWNKLYDEDDADVSYAVAVDGLGNIYVAGIAVVGAPPDYLLIKYNTNGDQLWVKTWGASGSDVANAVAADASGNAYITGSYYNGADNDFRTIKYDPGGNLQWGQSYDEFGNTDEAHGVAVDGAGNVYVAGFTYNGSNQDFLTIKYDKDGNLLWRDVRDENYNDRAYGVAVDAGGNVYVGGGAEDDGGTDVDFFAVKYDTDGNFQWKKRYGDDNMNYAEGIAVDQFFVYLTGRTNNGVDPDFLTIRYDKEGNFGWEKLFDSGDIDIANGVAVDPSHYVYVTGFTVESSDFDFRTIKYEQDDIPAVEETPLAPPLNLDVVENLSPTPTLNYMIPEGTGRLIFYSAEGRKVDEITLSSSQSSFTWNKEVPAGVYFASLTAGNLKITAKTIVTR